MYMVDFERDLREQVIVLLKREGVKYKEKDDLRTLLIKWFTYDNKRIRPIPRQVCWSSELLGKLDAFPDSVKEAGYKLQEWIEKGIDINAFQGRGLYGNGNRDYQYMVCGITHLHLSAKKEDQFPVVKKNGFAKPGKYLLYVVVKRECIYFVDIKEHPESLDHNHVEPSWMSSELLSIIKNNWSFLLDEKELRGIVSLCDADGNKIQVTEKEHCELAVNAINSPFSIDGKYYIPGLGMVGNGDSMEAVLAAQKIMNRMHKDSIFFEQHKIQIRNQFVFNLLKRGEKKIMLSHPLDLHYQCDWESNTSMLYDKFYKVGYFFSV